MDRRQSRSYSQSPGKRANRRSGFWRKELNQKDELVGSRGGANEHLSQDRRAGCQP